MKHLEIKKDKRAKGKYFHRVPAGIKATKSRQIAIKDISEECGEGNIYERNYLNCEKELLDSLKYDFKYISI